MRHLNRQQQGRPAKAPGYRITLAGQRISPELGARLVSLSLVDKRGFDSDQLDITLADHDGRLALPSRGATLQLAIGWQGQGLVDRGTYIVDEIEHSGPPDQLIIRARAADMRNALPGKRTQSWHQLTLGDIVTTIAARHQVAPRITAKLASTAISHIDQTDESDLHFLTRLAERFDADATIKAGHLLFLPRGKGTTAGGVAIPPVTLSRGDGDKHRYILTERDAFSGVIAHYHHIATGQREQVLVGSADNPKTLRGNFADEINALEEANAEWRRIRRAGASLHLDLAEGRADLYPETPIQARGWKADIDSTPWVATEVAHALSDSGYTCAVECEVMGAEDDGGDDEGTGQTSG
ncbi:MAG: phage late control D family protein [Porticoccaceae bacterium]|nr:phage late control D family protein [Porticoccaceae bacterium]